MVRSAWLVALFVSEGDSADQNLRIGVTFGTGRVI
jgi:hypothetical protein